MTIPVATFLELQPSEPILQRSCSMATELSDLIKESTEDCLSCTRLLSSKAGRPKTLWRANEPRRKAEDTKYMMGCIREAVELIETDGTGSPTGTRSIVKVL